ncbi:hypothetical protein [Saccharomonospora cyanea]|uniref:Uncharacterized protein n=1 Tax=Saccharomonospora cyanea NA-134 TaxID=882082 RepID=H5XD81_9PSEU|nr:hypothetical protein [Saccharomonospora cyanea]EHR59161.1 hypothetical protein SaccyDRAFT_0222 [Saccharomonospora cyanea NA-134]
MAPDVLRRTPHEAGMLDRTGIISSSAPCVPDAFDVPPDAYRHRGLRAQFGALVAVVLMAAVLVTGVRERHDSPTEIARTTTGGSQVVEGVPVASSLRSSPPVLLDGEPDATERTTSSPVPEDTTSRTSPMPSSSVEPTLRKVVPSVVPADPDRRRDSADSWRDDRGELPVPIDVPRDEPGGPSLDALPMSTVFTPPSPADEALRARSDEQRRSDAPSVRPTRDRPHTE